MTTASPLVRRKPQAIATCEPLFRARRTPRTRASVATAAGYRERIVARMVVNDDPLPVNPQRSHRLDDARVKALEVLGFVERRRDDGDHSCAETALVTASITLS